MEITDILTMKRCCCHNLDEMKKFAQKKSKTIAKRKPGLLQKRLQNPFVISKKTEKNVFAIDSSYAKASLVLIPVPWDVTTSYGKGTSLGPKAILKASSQVDLFDLDFGNAVLEKPVFMLQSPTSIEKTNSQLRKKAEFVMSKFESENNPSVEKKVNQIREEVNRGSQWLNESIYETSKQILADGKKVAVVGGDHSSPFGLIRAVLEKHPAAGILHVDAHADLRDSYMGFSDSHASIFSNVLKRLNPKALVQIGIRDFCFEEFELSKRDQRVHTFFDRSLKESLLQGKPWSQLISEILQKLPNEVYISFDIDGLDPALCPSTGTPVPGGLSWEQAQSLLIAVKKSGRTIVGFDVNEVSPGKTEWDANVGARLLFLLSNLAITP